MPGSGEVELRDLRSIDYGDDGYRPHRGPEKFLDTISYPVLREELQDFMTNQQFRKDYWVKGAKQLTALEQREALRKLSVVLTVDKEDVTLSFKGSAVRSDLDLRCTNQS